jgi:hypothetical protein
MTLVTVGQPSERAHVNAYGKGRVDENMSSHSEAKSTVHESGRGYEMIRSRFALDNTEGGV